MNYEDNKRRILQSLQGENQNTDVSEDLTKHDLVNRPENFTKTIVVINLIKDYDFQHGVGGTFHPSVEIIIGGPNQTPVTPIG